MLKEQMKRPLQIVDDDEILGAELVAFPPGPEYETLSYDLGTDRRGRDGSG